MDATLDPTTWPANEIEPLLAAPSLGYDTASGTGGRGMVIGGTVPLAQYAGRRALEAGGSAVDAAIVTALLQITFAGGAYISFAGIAEMVIHDAASGETVSIGGPFKTFAGETDPRTIPANPVPSGRTAMVGGFFAAIQEAHDRYGRLDWTDLLEPAIHFARAGVPVGDILLRAVSTRSEVLQRTPEAREIFFPDGDPALVQGGMLRQRQLAETLCRITAEGASYLYTGDWAHRFVEIVQREGGKASLDDLAGYEPLVSEGVRGSVYGVDLIGPGEPNIGGTALIEGLRLCETLGVKDPTTDGESLRWLVAAARQSHNLRLLPAVRRLAPGQAETVAAAMRGAGGPVGPSRIAPGSHSDYVTTADADGNVVAMCHSINCVMWGATGMFVDGISIPDAASFQQQDLARLEQGAILPHPMNPTMATKDGEVVLAMSSIGAGLNETTLTHMHGVLGLGLPVAEAVERPRVHFLDMLRGDSVTSAIEVDEDASEEPLAAGYDAMRHRAEELTEQLHAEGDDPMDLQAMLFEEIPSVVEDGFAEDVVELARAAGAKLTVMSIDDPALPRGFWAGLSRDPQTGMLQGARSPGSTGLVEGI